MKRGSSSIFLMMIMAALSAAILVFIHAAEAVSTASMSHAYVNLASRSVLSEYNINLKEDYNLFATGLQEDAISQRIRYYLKQNLPDQGFVKMKANKIQTDVSNYSLASVENFEREILQAGQYVLGHTRGKSNKHQENDIGKVLKNEIILNNLPSNGFSSGLFNLELISDKASNIKGFIQDP